MLIEVANLEPLHSVYMMPFTGNEYPFTQFSRKNSKGRDDS